MTIARTYGTCHASAPAAASRQGVVQMYDNDTTLIPDDDTLPLAGEWQRIADHERGRAPAPRGIQAVGRTQAFTAGGERGKMRAGDADRDGVVERLNMAYSEGRLSKDEYDGRLDNALSARTYADLDQLVTDLPEPAGEARHRELVHLGHRGHRGRPRGRQVDHQLVQVGVGARGQGGA